MRIALFAVFAFSTIACAVPKRQPTTFDDLPRGDEQREAMCAYLEREDIDSIVRTKFCVGEPPAIRSLRDLQRVLDLGCPDYDTNIDYPPYVLNEVRVDHLGREIFTEEDERLQEMSPIPDSCEFYAATTMSSSLVMKQVSPLNPRALIFSHFFKPGESGREDDDPDGYRIMGFTRGEHFVELITENRNKQILVNGKFESDINFFLINFEQACTTDNACTNAERYGEAIESDWTGYTIFSENDLKNTVVDCLQCHQSGLPDAPSPRRSLLMQEVERPWPHFLQSPNNDRGPIPRESPDFLTELPNKKTFLAAHAHEARFAGIPVANFAFDSQPRLLEEFMTNRGFGDGYDPALETQPIQDDVSRLRRYRFSDLQLLNQGGKIIQHPTIRSGDLTDPDKKAATLQSIDDHRAGLRDDILDLADVFLSGQAEEYERLSLRVTPGSTGEEIIRQACSQCHNHRLDQTITRARFSATKIDQMPANELRLAQKRIMLEDNNPLRMPPARFRDLYPDEKQRAVDYLETLIDQRLD